MYAYFSMEVLNVILLNAIRVLFWLNGIFRSVTLHPMIELLLLFENEIELVDLWSFNKETLEELRKIPKSKTSATTNSFYSM